MKKIISFILIFSTLIFVVGCNNTNSSDINTDNELHDQSDIMLKYELSEDKKSYYIVGVDSFTGSDLIIPDTFKNLPVTQIKDYAFSNCSDLKTITIGRNITNIEIRAFYNCNNIIEVTFNAINCNDLSSTPFSNIGSNIAGGAIVKIGKDVERIPAFLFGKEEFDLDLITIGSLIFDKESKCTEIGKYAFGNSLICETLALPHSVESIGEKAFYGNTALIQVTLPQSLKTIGYDAFGNCWKLVEIYNPSSVNLKLGNKENGQIAYNAIVIHTDLSDDSILINQNDFIFFTEDGKNYLISYIGENLNIILPANYRGASYTIYQYSFYESDIESVVISKGVNGINHNAFGTCSKLKYATFEDPYGWKYQNYMSIFEFIPEALQDSVNAAEMLGGGSFNFINYADENWFKE